MTKSDGSKKKVEKDEENSVKTGIFFNSYASMVNRQPFLEIYQKRQFASTSEQEFVLRNVST